jgi:N-acetylneuraminic acid mutarotase
MWTQKANMPGTARCGAVGWGTFPTGFIATGEDITGTYKNDVWEYNYFNNQWIQRTSIPAPGRKHAFVFMLNNIAFVGSGYNGDFMDDCYAYTPLVGIAEQNNETVVNTFPNPATSFINIEVKTAQFEQNILQLFAANGQNVTAQCDVTANASGFTVQVEQLAAGTYFYVITDTETDTPLQGSFVKN